MIIDLRSDTVTRPTPGMLAAMHSAPVGDDVFNEDPTIIALEEKAATLFGMEAAIFCPSGTMTNQIAIKVHTQPGDEVICHRLSHIYNYEGGGIAMNSGASMRLIEGDRGRFTARDVVSNINPNDIHFPITSMVGVENTCNKGGGCYYDFAHLQAIGSACKQHDLALHLDGARLFNALVETPETAANYGQVFDTISICLSKGLGAPVGSLLLGTAAHIQRARRIRKVLGGGMRQAGYLAAAGIYALDHHVDRLVEDHQRAKAMESILQPLPFVKQVLPVDTNIVVFELAGDLTNEAFIGQLETQGVKVVPFGPQTIRMTAHLDFDDDQLTALEQVLKSYSLSTAG